jgi:hypothetical protein
MGCKAKQTRKRLDWPQASPGMYRTGDPNKLHEAGFSAICSQPRSGKEPIKKRPPTEAVDGR